MQGGEFNIFIYWPSLGLFFPLLRMHNMYKIITVSSFLITQLFGAKGIKM